MASGLVGGWWYGQDRKRKGQGRMWEGSGGEVCLGRQRRSNVRVEGSNGWRDLGSQRREGENTVVRQIDEK